MPATAASASYTMVVDDDDAPICSRHGVPKRCYVEGQGRTSWRCRVCMRERERKRERARGASPFGSPEHRAKISAASTGRRHTAEARARVSAAQKALDPARRLRGEWHPSWKGHEIRSHSGLHDWLAKNFPKTGHCECCGSEGATQYAFLRHPEPHTRDREEDYAELCASCHQRMDAFDRKLRSLGIKVIRVRS